MDISLSKHTDNRKKNPSEGSIDGLDDTSIAAEAKHSF